jgi:NLP/P60 family protein
MVRKSTLTMACMLLTVGCTGLQTNSENDSKTRKNNNDLSANSNSDDRDDNIVIEIIGNNKKGNTGDSQSNNIEKKYGNHDKNNESESDIEKVTERNSYTNENLDDLKITKLFDENSLVDRSMPNSQLVLQKLSELKRKQQEILKHGTVSQKKTVKLQNDLLKSYSHWKGTKYELGGDSPSGMDCSALTRRVYREVYGYELPRQTVQQIKVGAHIPRENLKPGDIVFFKPEDTNNHTAVYLGDSLFINASSSKGVVISTLENTYWNKYFKYGVRVRMA